MTWDVEEPWETPLRTAEESAELVRRLDRRHAERWRRLLATLARQVEEDRRWIRDCGSGAEGSSE